MMIQPNVPVLETSPDDPRLGQLISRAAQPSRKPQVVLIGFPTDEGVRRNGGRAGAAQGPDAVRAELYRMTPDASSPGPWRSLLAVTSDLGNLQTSSDLERDQQELAAAIAPWLAEGVLVIVIGGGHETTYGHFLGYARAGLRAQILNWDAHPDVRELIDGKGHSGSSFRQALLDPQGACQDYTVAGLIPPSVAQAHADFVTARGGRILWGQTLDRTKVSTLYGSFFGPTLVSFDLDAVDQAYAPGVSAPAAGGLSPDIWLAAAFEAGRCRFTRSIDVVEVNPSLDRDSQTARLAATTIWWFLKGVLER
jgi:formiminoglutamase